MEIMLVTKTQNLSSSLSNTSKTASLPLFETAKLVVNLYTKNSPSNGKSPYAVALVERDGCRHPALIPGEEFDLSKVEHLVGLTVSLRPTERGLRLKPLSQQPETLVETLTERLSNKADLNLESDHIIVDKNSNDSNLETRGDSGLSVMPTLRSLISNVAEQCQKHQLAAAAWLFLPATPFEDEQND